ncbi:MAG: trimethylamine methyltransferase family protein [Pseudomonadota bacterium]
MSDIEPIDGNAMNQGAAPRRRRGRRAAQDGGSGGSRAAANKRAHTYRKIARPYSPLEVLSADQVATIHETALRVLEELGVKVLLPEAREIFAAAGAKVGGDQIVHIDRGLIAQALAHAPSTFTLHGGADHRHQSIGGNSFTTVPIGGPPHISDLDQGKRPGTMADTTNIIRLSQHFDVLHTMSPNVEPQDTPMETRHLLVSEAQLTNSDKPVFVYSRGAPQVRDCFEMVRIARGLDADAFRAAPYCYTVINTNSPRQLDIPMCQGMIDFARAGQPSIITPFTLSGAMAPVTIAGALTLQHAEALAGITLVQLTNPGAPVVYGSFTSNVDMKSGAPAFGTPEFIKGSFAAGQLARHIDLPWRSSNANASNAPDAQATYEALNSVWAAMMGGANMLFHAAGWLEGGLTASMEKFIIDVEMLQIMAEANQPLEVDADAIGFDAIAEVETGGHFFAAQHTMARYQDAFYAPMLSDWSNFGRWTETGAKTATERANAIWKQTLADFEPPKMDDGRRDALADFVARRTNEGGAPPES